MREVGAIEAKTDSLGVLAEIEAGETATITRRGKAVARLVPVQGQQADRIAALHRLKRLGAQVRLSQEETISARDEGRR